MTEIERYKHPDQWKHFGRCEVCRRQKYCKKQCTMNREFAAAALREYLRKAMLARREESKRGDETADSRPEQADP